MKKNLPLMLSVIYALCSIEAYAQWCVPTTVSAYNSDMPGITRVVINTIDRVSADLEDMNNNYVNTGLSTDLVLGQSYNISISYTIDANICPDMNLRVWIDFNQDGQLDDIGETVISVDNQLPGTYSGSFTIPTTATVGVTRMRVTAKMTSNGGHSLPTPCDIPVDILGYHGEMEDYTVDITSITGINNPTDESNGIIISTLTDKIKIGFTTTTNSDAELILMDLNGKFVKEVLPVQAFTAGEYSFELNTKENEISSGIYLLKYTFDNNTSVKRIFIEQ